MKVNEACIYPYPVYRLGSEDYENSDFPLETVIEYDSTNAYIHIQASIPDAAIKDLLEENKVGLYCHIECPRTKYREMFEIDGVCEDVQDIIIDLAKLNEDIEVMCFLVAKEEIVDFKDDNFSEFYKGDSIRFPQYARIGYSEPYNTRITKRLNISGEVPSIFSVIPDSEINCMSYNADNHKIIIYLPENEHDIYCDYHGIDRKIKIMMMNLAVLTEIISNIQKDADCYSDYDWFSVIEENFANKGISDLTADTFKAKPAVEMAQILIPNLCKEAFREFDLSHRSNNVSGGSDNEA